MSEVAGTLCVFRSKFLVLQRPDGSWDLPKGIVRDESLRKAALRETREETGLTPQITGEPISDSHKGDTIWIFPAEARFDRVSLSDEHRAFDWVSASKASSILYPPLARIVRRMTSLGENLLCRTPLAEAEDPHAHLKADPKRKPPSGSSDRYYSQSALRKAHRANYYRDDTRESKFATSYETPAKHIDVPLGSWRIDDGHKWTWGREVDELRAYKPREIHPHPGEMEWKPAGEDPTKGLRERVRQHHATRYADWIDRSHGEKDTVARIPPLDVTQHAKGHLRIGDGHRRLAAVELANQRRKAREQPPLKIPGWTSWVVRDHPDGGTVSLTHKIAQEQGINRDYSPPPGQQEEDMDITELRDSCLSCTRKHLAQALVLMHEVKQGYPEHKWLAIGHMGEAADESLKEHPELAAEIRKHRLAYEKDTDYQVPILDLLKRATKLAGNLAEDECGHKKHPRGALVPPGLEHRQIAVPDDVPAAEAEEWQKAQMEERAERSGAVAVSLLKPGTKRWERHYARATRRRKRTMQQEEREANKDGTTACGVFIPLPYNLAKDFPNKRQEDDSMPHYTVLYVGDLPPKAFWLLARLVKDFAMRLKPFEVDLAHYGEFINPEGKKIAWMGPSLHAQLRLRKLHGMLRRYIEHFGRSISIGHTYGSEPPSKLIPYEVSYKPHATLAYLPPTSVYRGPKPTGAWTINELEIWGYEHVRVPFGHNKYQQPVGLTRDPISTYYPMAVPPVISEAHQDRLKGGLADKSKPEDFDPKELAMGIKVEKEHTDDPRLAREIASDHLKEIPDYYTRLAKMEKKAGVEESVMRRIGNRWAERHSTPAGTGPSQGGTDSVDSTLPGLFLAQQQDKKLRRSKLAGLK